MTGRTIVYTCLLYEWVCLVSDLTFSIFRFFNNFVLKEKGCLKCSSSKSNFEMPTVMELCVYARECMCMLVCDSTTGNKKCEILLPLSLSLFSLSLSHTHTHKHTHTHALTHFSPKTGKNNTFNSFYPILSFTHPL